METLSLAVFYTIAYTLTIGAMALMNIHLLPFLLVVVYGLWCWMKHRKEEPTHPISFIIWLTCLIIFAYGTYGMVMEGWKWQQALKWNDVEKIVEYDHITTPKGKELTLEKTKIVKIPQTVYDNMSELPDKKEHFLADKKQVIVVSAGPETCPYWNSFKQKVQEVFNDTEIRKTYDFSLYRASGCEFKHLPYSDDATVEEMRKAYQHPCGWIDAHCQLSKCISNPQTHEAVIYVRQQPEHVVPLLKEYEDWEDEPLLP